MIETISREIKPIHQKNNSYHYINPLLSYEVPSTIKKLQEYTLLKQKVQSEIDHKPSSVDTVSVYFRDLTEGRWMGIDENVGYAPASMMKVAIMIAYFMEAENNPTLLSQSWKYSSNVAAEIQSIPFQTPSHLEVGKSYTVEELIEDMITSSDNGSKNLLLDNIDQ